MDPGVVMAALIGIIGGLLAVVVMFAFGRPHVCPDCGKPLPRVRNYWASFRVFWICPECGCAIGCTGARVER